MESIYLWGPEISNSQNLIDWSADPVTTPLLSGESVTDQTGPVCASVMLATRQDPARSNTWILPACNYNTTSKYLPHLWMARITDLCTNHCMMISWNERRAQGITRGQSAHALKRSSVPHFDFLGRCSENLRIVRAKGDGSEDGDQRDRMSSVQQMYNRMEYLTSERCPGDLIVWVSLSWAPVIKYTSTSLVCMTTSTCVDKHVELVGELAKCVCGVS